jgi:hypothetical protein
MADATADWKSVLRMMSEAFSAGDNRRGEELLTVALDGGAPWDAATSAVARALSRRDDVPRRSPAPTPASA